MTALTVQDLRKSFRSPSGQTAAVVDAPRFELAAGEQAGLRGRSGSGKTTFLHLVAGVYAADSGTVRIADREMTGLSEGRRDRLRAETIGYIFQTFNLLQAYTALENVLLGMAFGGGPKDSGRARELLKRVDLGDRLGHYPRQLSVGQQQRVAVARALANRPRLVLADEPTGNLDRDRAAEALRLIREVCDESGAALLLVSHDDEALAAFERRHDFSEINRAAAREGDAA